MLLAGAAFAALAFVPTAAAQDSEERFIPPIGDWSLQPDDPQETPAPAPAPAPTPAQPPVVVPQVPPTATPAPSPAPARRQTPAPTSAPPPEPAASPTPAPAPAPAESAPPEPAPDADTASPVAAQPTLAAPPQASPVPTPITPDEAGGLPRWLVALLAIGLAGGAGRLLLRRRRRAETVEPLRSVAEPAEAPAEIPPSSPRAAPASSVPVRRVTAEDATARRPAPPPVRTAPPAAARAAPSAPAPPPAAADPSLPKGLITTRVPPLGRAAPPPPPPAAPQAPSRPVVPLPAAQRPPAGVGGLGFAVNIHRITLSLAQLTVEFDLVAENMTDVAVDGLDIATALITAHENQDAQIERFFAERPDAPASAIEVAAHSARPLAGRLAMPIAQANRIETNGRAYCVPIMMIDARFRWADGRDERKSAAFVLGKGVQDAPKLGPVFLDRGPTTLREVGARRHIPLRKAS